MEGVRNACNTEKCITPAVEETTFAASPHYVPAPAFARTVKSRGVGETGYPWEPEPVV